MNMRKPFSGSKSQLGLIRQALLVVPAAILTTLALGAALDGYLFDAVRPQAVFTQDSGWSLFGVLLASSIVVTFAAAMLAWRRKTRAIARPGTARGSDPVLLTKTIVAMSRDDETRTAVSPSFPDQSIEAEPGAKELQETLDTRESHEVALLLASKKAEYESEIKAEFLANISHAIRTPMNGVIGFAGLLGSTSLDVTQREYLDSLTASATHLLTIIDDLIDYAQLEAHEVQLAEDAFSLRTCVEDAIAAVTSQAHDKNLELVSMVYNDVIDSLIGDQVRIGQILTNLLSNALKFTAAGEVVLRVMREHEDDGACTLMLSVTDTGIGIPAAEQAQLFSPFHQMHAGKQREYGGTGLELSICRKLVEAMGGSISVSSHVDAGSCFRVTLRLAKDSSKTTSRQDRFAGISAVLIEPHDLARIALANMLAALGIDIASHASLEGLHFDGKIPDIVIIAAAGDSGGVAQMIRLVETVKGRFEGPVLALLNSSIKKLFPPILGAGAAGCLSKPVRRSQLTSAIEDCLNVQARFDAAGEPAEKPSKTWLSGRRILVVDDTAISIQLMHSLLSTQGAHVLTARDGDEAIRVFTGSTPDIIFMDIHMPRLNGLRTAREIRALEGHRRTPIIALTADRAAQDADELANADLDDYLVKPIDETRLFAVIAHCLHLVPPEPTVATDLDAESAPHGDGTLAMRDDLKALRVTGGSQQVADKLFAEFCVDLPVSLDNLRKAYAVRDWKMLWDVAHRLHGAAAVCALPAMHAALDSLQRSSRQQHHAKATAALADVQRQATRLTSGALLAPGARTVDGPPDSSGVAHTGHGN